MSDNWLREPAKFLFVKALEITHRSRSPHHHQDPDGVQSYRVQMVVISNSALVKAV
jgi:hypothetical protein